MTLYLAEMKSKMFPPAPTPEDDERNAASSTRGGGSPLLDRYEKQAAHRARSPGLGGSGDARAESAAAVETLKKVGAARSSSQRGADDRRTGGSGRGRGDFNDRLARMREMVHNATGGGGGFDSTSTDRRLGSRAESRAESRGRRDHRRERTPPPPMPTIASPRAVDHRAPAAERDHGGDSVGGGGGSSLGASTSMASFVMDYRESQLIRTSYRRTGSRSGSTSRRSGQGRQYAATGGYGGGGSEVDNDDNCSESSFGSCSVLDDGATAAESPQAAALRHKFFTGWLNRSLAARFAGDAGFNGWLMPQSLVDQASDARMLLTLMESLMGQRYDKQLAVGSEHTARLANMTIVLRLIKKELRPFCKVRSTVQRDLLNRKPTTVLNLLWCMVGAHLVRKLQKQGASLERVSELPQLALHWAAALTEGSSAALLDDLGVDRLDDVSGEAWMNGKLLLHLMTKVGQAKRDRVDTKGGPAAKGDALPLRDLNEWKRLVADSFGTSKVAVWSAALNGLAVHFKAMPEGLLDAQLDCLVVWKSSHVMTLLLAELMVAAGGPKVPGAKDFKPTRSPDSPHKEPSGGGGGGGGTRGPLPYRLPSRGRFDSPPRTQLSSLAPEPARARGDGGGGGGGGGRSSPPSPAPPSPTVPGARGLSGGRSVSPVPGGPFALDGGDHGGAGATKRSVKEMVSAIQTTGSAPARAPLASAPVAGEVPPPPAHNRSNSMPAPERRSAPAPHTSWPPASSAQQQQQQQQLMTAAAEAERLAESSQISSSRPAASVDRERAAAGGGGASSGRPLAAAYLTQVRGDETIESMGRRLRDSERRRDEAEQTVAQLRSDLAHIKEETLDAGAAKGSAEARIRELSAALSAERVAHASTKSRNTELETRLLATQKEEATEVYAFAELQKAEKEVEAMRKRLESANQQLTIAVSKTKAMEKELRLNEAKLADAQGAVIESEVARQTRKEAAEAKDRELATAQAQLAHLLRAITGGDGAGVAEFESAFGPAGRALSPEQAAKKRLASPSKALSPPRGGAAIQGISPEPALSPAPGVRPTRASMQLGVAEARVADLERRLRDAEADAEGARSQARLLAAKVATKARDEESFEGVAAEGLNAAEEELAEERSARAALEQRVDKVEKALVKASAMHRAEAARADELADQLADATDALGRLADADDEAAALLASGGGGASGAPRAGSSIGRGAASPASEKDAEYAAAMAARAAALEEELEEAMGQIEALEREADELRSFVRHTGSASSSAAASPGPSGRSSPTRKAGGGRNGGAGDDEGDNEGDEDEDAALRDVAALQAALENAFLQNSELEGAVAELEARLAEAEADAAARAAGDASAASEEEGRLRAEVQALKADVEKAGFAAQASAAAAAAESKRLEAAEDAVQASAMAAHRAEGDKEALRAQLAELEEALARARAEGEETAKELSSELADAMAEGRKAAKDVAALRKETAGHKDKANAAAATAAGCKAAVEKLEAELAAAEMRAETAVATAAAAPLRASPKRDEGEAVRRAAAATVAAAEEKASEAEAEASDLRLELVSAQAASCAKASFHD